MFVQRHLVPTGIRGGAERVAKAKWRVIGEMKIPILIRDNGSLLSRSIHIFESPPPNLRLRDPRAGQKEKEAKQGNSCPLLFLCWSPLKHFSSPYSLSLKIEAFTLIPSPFQAEASIIPVPP